MSTYNITIEGIDLEVKYDYTAPEPETGFYGKLDIEEMKIEGTEYDVYELIDPKHLKSIKNEIWDKIKDDEK